MNTYASPPNYNDLIRWPHSVFSVAAGLMIGPSEDSEPRSCDETDSDRIPLKKKLSEVKRMNGALKLAGRFECLFCPDLLDNLPKETRSQSAIWDAVEESTNISWLLLTRHPDLVTAKLPTDWGSSGFCNVCIGVYLDGSDDENRHRVQVLREIPARYRAIWVQPTSTPEFTDDWLHRLHWVIADLPDGWLPGLHIGIAGPVPQFEDWRREIRDACHKSGVACFLLPGKGTEQCIADCEVGIPHHPFQSDLTLFECSPYGRLSHLRSSISRERPIAIDNHLADASITEAALPVADKDHCSGAASPVALDHVIPPSVSPLDVIITTAHSPKNAIVELETKRQRFERLDNVVKAGMRASIDAGFAFKQIRDDELWREGDHKSWNDYCESILEASRSHINRLIKHATISQELRECKPPYDLCGEPILPVSESQSRPLKKLSDSKERAKAWRTAVKRAGGLPTANIVMDVVSEILAPAAPTKPNPSRGEQRLELIKSLRDAASSKDSWDRVVDLIDLLENLESPKPRIK